MFYIIANIKCNLKAMILFMISVIIIIVVKIHASSRYTGTGK